jgi:agmatinase
LNEWVYTTTKEYLRKGKKVALLGGDHSTPYGFIKALATVHDSFAILQIDAHADLRKAYQGFLFSHASIMYNVMEHIPQVSRLVQLGLRDYCDEEYEYAKGSEERIMFFSDRDIKNEMYEGNSWKSICDRIISCLPQKIYISFDIDGLDPKLCPNTGTPVPGGFELEQVFYLFRQLREHHKIIIGFDLNEVSGNQNSIDPIVGARALYKLCGHLLLSE